jgi:poly-gamma-glutamate synthesis protein (capsule biosynthesis protein)
MVVYYLKYRLGFSSMTRFLLSSLLALSIFLSACSSVPQPLQTSSSPTPSANIQPPTISTLTPSADQQTTAEQFIGRVIDMDGAPISGAKVESPGKSTTSDKDGWFRFSADGLPQWIKVTAAGFISRTRAAAPAVPVLFRLSPDDGKTTVIHFAGDTMFGRRFYDPNEDDYTADGLLPLEPTVDDHLKLLAPVSPLLQSADFTVLNFETTLAEQAYLSKNASRPVTFHPTAGHVYASNPNSVMALKQSGVDIVGLANNHMYDMLEVGLYSTLATLDRANMLHFGAGANETNAWAPAMVSSKGQIIAFIGCTTLKIPLQTPVLNDIPYTASDVLKKGGAAYCAEARLRAEITQAKQQADIVVVMIHGGKEYDSTPTSKISYLTSIAKQAGATLVINHHPHVTGGFQWRDQALTAWTLGTFLSDQTVWPSLESYILAVYLRDGNVVRAYVEPLMIDGFLPHGLTSELADYVVRGAAGHEPGPFVMESGAMEVDIEGRTLQQTYVQTIDGGSDSGMIISMPQAQWISDFKGTGKLRLGRDLLWVGGFENNEVASVSGAAPLWDLSLGDIQLGPEYAYEGQTGIRLERGARNNGDAVTTNLHRVLIRPYADLSITGMVRADSGVVVQAQLSWYSTTSGPSFSKTLQPIEVQSHNSWEPFRLDVQAPRGAVAAGLFLRLSPPDKGTASADFDNIRIIQWASPSSSYSPLYNYALLTGTGELTFTQQILPGAEKWLVTQPTIQPIQ